MTFTKFARAFALTTVLLTVGLSHRLQAAPDAAGLDLIVTPDSAGTVYVTLTSQGNIRLDNWGSLIIHVTSITSTDPDAVNGFIRLTLPTMPISIVGGQTVNIPFTFAPNAPDIVSGERKYRATFTISNDGRTANLKTTINGEGVLVHASATLGAMQTAKVGDTITTPVLLDKWIDPLGQTLVRTLKFEMLHYRRTVVAVQPSFNTSGAGGAGTLTAGAIVTEDLALDTLADAAHTNGEQGFYSLFVTGTTSAVRATGTLLNLRFVGVKGTDTSRLVFRVKDFRTIEGTALPYVIMTTTDGVIHIDSVHKQDTVINGVANNRKSPIHQGLVLNPGSPNPFSSFTDISYSVSDRTPAQLMVCDVRGKIVAMLVEGEVSAGEHHASFTTGALPSGEYFAVLRTPTGIVMQDLALVR